MISKLSAFIATLSLALAGLAFAPTVAAASTNMTLTVSGGLSHSVGDTITFTPSGPYTGFSGTFTCEYMALINQQLAPNSGSNAYSYVQVFAFSVNGVCPAWTVTLPNLAQMAYFSPGADTSVQVNIVAIQQSPYAYDSSPNYTVSFHSSAGTPTPTSNLPVVFWTVSPIYAAPGGTITITPIVVAPSGYSQHGGCVGEYQPSQTAIDDPTCAPFSFTQVSPGTGLQFGASFDPFTCWTGGCGWFGSGDFIWIQDPTLVDPTPAPCPAASPSTGKRGDLHACPHINANAGPYASPHPATNANPCSSYTFPCRKGGAGVASASVALGFGLLLLALLISSLLTIWRSRRLLAERRRGQ